MPDSITLAHIILVELIAALTLVTGILLYVLRRERKAHKRLLAEHQRMRSTIKVGTTPLPGTPDLRHLADASGHIDPVAEHLHHCQEAAQTRYHTITQTRVPRLTPEAPFNAKIAALRYLYCSAEMEAYQKRKASQDTWVFLERRLYDIARWVIERKEKGKDKQKSNQILLLQKRVESLKPYQEQAQVLQRKLELAQVKQKQLQSYQEESLNTINKLRRINYALSLSQEHQPLSADDVRHSFTLELQERPDTSSPAENRHRLDNISELSARYQSLNSELTSGLRVLYGQTDGQGQENLATTVQQLETELERSQHYIDQLKSQLMAAVAAPVITIPASSGHPSVPMAAREQRPLGKIEDTLQIIHTNLDQSPKVPLTSGGKKPEPRPHSLIEIQNLRANNRHQRNLIADLEKDLRGLRMSVAQTPDSDERDTKIQEMRRLEQLVKECEHCIEALESEVDLLYSRLQAHEGAPGGPADATLADDQPQVEEELESVSRKLQETLLQNRRDSIINQYALETLRTHSIEELAKCLIDAIKRAGLTAGFYIQSALGQAEFYRGNKFSDHERSLVKKTTIAAPVAYLNEGIFFASNHLHLLLKDPPEAVEELAQVEALLGALMNLSSARVHYLEVVNEAVHENRALDEWSNATRESLVGLEIRYAFQSEEIMRVFTTLGEELQQLTDGLDLSNNLHTALKNALSECRHRIDQVFSGEESLDHHCTEILEQLESLPRPGR